MIEITWVGEGLIPGRLQLGQNWDTDKEPSIQFNCLYYFKS